MQKQYEQGKLITAYKHDFARGTYVYSHVNSLPGWSSLHFLWREPLQPLPPRCWLYPSSPVHTSADIWSAWIPTPMIWGLVLAVCIYTYIYLVSCTYITGQLTGLLWHLVPRSKMCRETAFTSLLLVLFCIGILEEAKERISVYVIIYLKTSLISNIHSGQKIKPSYYEVIMKSVHRWRSVLVSWPEAPLGGQQMWCTSKFSPRALFYIPAERERCI